MSLRDFIRGHHEEIIMMGASGRLHAADRIAHGYASRR
jgi:hypothetical protein